MDEDVFQQFQKGNVYVSGFVNGYACSDNKKGFEKICRALGLKSEIVAIQHSYNWYYNLSDVKERELFKKYFKEYSEESTKRWEESHK